MRGLSIVTSPYFLANVIRKPISTANKIYKMSRPEREGERVEVIFPDTDQNQREIEFEMSFIDIL